MSLSPLISVVFSFRNEEEVIPELLVRVERALSPLPLRYELIFVNDASTDASRALLEAAARRDDRIKVANMSRRFGGVECQIAGLELARGDAVKAESRES